MSYEREIPLLGASLSSIVEIKDDRARELIDPAAELQRLVEGCTWTEGPVYLPAEQAVVFSEIPSDRALRWSETDGVSEWRNPNDFGNGNTLDREGRIVHCEHGNRRVARTELDGSRHGIVDRFEGRKLNSPNDVVVKSDGTVWFSDPPYGIRNDREGHAAEQEQSGCHVYRFDPETDEVTLVSEYLEHPNGLAFSPVETRLYVSDTSAVPESGAEQQAVGNHHIVVLDVVDGRSLENPRVFEVIDEGLADGLRCDVHGNVWTSAADGIHILAPDATELARIHIPEVVSNLVFGGPDGMRLFVTASSSLYAIDVLVPGAGVAAEVTRATQPK